MHQARRQPDQEQFDVLELVPPARNVNGCVDVALVQWTKGSVIECTIITLEISQGAAADVPFYDHFA